MIELTYNGVTLRPDSILITESPIYSGGRIVRRNQMFTAQGDVPASDWTEEGLRAAIDKIGVPMRVAVNGVAVLDKDYVMAVKDHVITRKSPDAYSVLLQVTMPMDGGE